ncbi:MAG: hypothetical protein FWE80_00010 [Oscillospiraceae bacterium]|nr:hypothetical protein [Oscillospiraceae bacterium]
MTKIKAGSIVISILIAGVLVFIGLTMLANAVTNRPVAYPPTYLTGDINVNRLPEMDSSILFKEYMNLDEAADYLGFDDDHIGIFNRILREGVLDGTYLTYQTGNDTKPTYMFSKTKLDACIVAMMEQGSTF